MSIASTGNHRPSLAGWPALLLGLAIGAQAAAADEQAPLSSYLGNQSVAAPWAGFVRGVGLRATGMALFSPASDGRNVLDESCLNALAADVAGLIGSRDVVLPVGGLGSARRQSRVNEFMTLIELDSGATWKRMVRTQAERLAALPGGLERVYWQVGNEINSKHYSLTLGTWAGLTADASEGAQGRARSGDRRRSAQDDAERGPGQRPRRGEREAAPAGQEEGATSVRCASDSVDEDSGDERHLPGGSRNDSRTIPLYAEYFLAPTVAGLQAAAKALGHDPRAINVMLGTLANARSSAGRAWLDQLLEYRLEGRFAPELAGKRVYELVDIIAIHYVVSYPGSDWRASLDELSSRWIGKGDISGLWSTEEIGRSRGMRGLGASFSLRIAFRYFDWWRSHGYGPRQGRVNFYASSLGSPEMQADRALGLLQKHFGVNALRRLDPAQIETNLDKAVEAYGMGANAGGRSAYVVFPAGTTAAGRLDELRVPLFGTNRDASAQVHLFSPDGHRSWRVQSKLGAAHLELRDLDVTLDADSTVLVLIGDNQ